MTARSTLCTASLALLALPGSAVASPIVIDFDDLNDSDAIVAQYTNLDFSNAIALTAGISLNEFDFPPRSGFNVASDDGAPIRVDFAQPVSDVAGYFTYLAPLMLQAFDADDVLLGSAASLFSSNTGLSGDPGSSPNEFLQLSFASISYVTFTGDPLGASFTLDDLTYVAPTQVPEPGTLTLVLLGAVSLTRLRRRASPPPDPRGNGDQPAKGSAFDIPFWVSPWLVHVAFLARSARPDRYAGPQRLQNSRLGPHNSLAGRRTSNHAPQR